MSNSCLAETLSISSISQFFVSVAANTHVSSKSFTVYYNIFI